MGGGGEGPRVVRGQAGEAVVCCSGASVGEAGGSGAAELRCRFGDGAPVAAELKGGDVRCVAPPGSGSVPLEVLAGAGGEEGDGDAVVDTVTFAYEEKTAPKAAPGGQAFGELRPFVIVSLSYLLYTVTDGAVRMIVLLHAYNEGFSAWDVALMFTLYEAAGAVTNLVAGVAGARWGIKRTLVSGLVLQLAGLGMLAGWSDGFSRTDATVYVTLAQMLCGIAKDLTKLGGKTVTKLVTAEGKETSLFKRVAMITGLKNSLKGAGYFLGAALLSWSYHGALAAMGVLVLLALPWAMTGLSLELGRSDKKNLTLADVFQKNYNVNVLSVARLFLFGSRDLWFEVPLPFFLRNGAVGLGWSRETVGLVLALWIIFYGQIQSWTPQLVLGPLRQSPPNKWHAYVWCAGLVVCPMALGLFVANSQPLEDGDPGAAEAAVLLAGLFAFALVFAVNSSIHSYLIVRYSEGNKVAMNVGYYYMANAVGRLTGTLVSGALYTYAGDSPIDGFAACFWASVAFVVTSAAVTLFIDDNVGGLTCGPLECCAPPAVAAAGDDATPTAPQHNSA